jgi:WD40 repeat protein
MTCLAFSHDGQFLAAAGQNGQLKLWQVQETKVEPIETLSQTNTWIDRLAWCPTRNQLAFSFGKSIQVWDAISGEIEATLNFDASSVLDLTWHPDGQQLSVGGYQGIKLWTAQDWQDDPYWIALDGASVAIA